MSKKFRDRQGSQSMEGYRLPEPAKADVALLVGELAMAVKAVHYLSAEVERLQAEVKTLKTVLRRYMDSSEPNNLGDSNE